MATVCLALFLMLTAAKLVVAAVRLLRRHRGLGAAVLVFGSGITSSPEPQARSGERAQKKPQSHAALRFDFARLTGQRGLAGAGRVDAGRACGGLAAGVDLATGAGAVGAGFAAGAGAAAGAGLADAAV